MSKRAGHLMVAMVWCLSHNLSEVFTADLPCCFTEVTVIVCVHT